MVMPYTNPTWWCDGPKGPTFERYGEAPLLKNLQGKPTFERYDRNTGFTVCHWHPAVREANAKTLRQFREDYPVDVLFQDQCGARGWQYDTNPASPTPCAYSEGLLSMIDEDSRSVPLSTECGWDRVVNAESQIVRHDLGDCADRRLARLVAEDEVPLRAERVGDLPAGSVHRARQDGDDPSRFLDSLSRTGRSWRGRSDWATR